MKSSKRYLENCKAVENLKEYAVSEAVSIIKEGKPVKFDETVEVVVNLGVDPRHSDQIVRGTVALPHGTGKDVKVLVFAKGDKVAEAEAAGADFVVSGLHVVRGSVAATQYMDLLTADGASNTISSMDHVLDKVNSARAASGATINRLEHAVDNLSNVSQNTSASRSRILDADYAAETAELARTQIVQQAGTAMLTQANQRANSILAFLK